MAARPDRDTDHVWRTVLQHYAAMGRPSHLDEIPAGTGLVHDRIVTLLRTLQQHDLVGLENGSGAIRHAYPFTESATGHRVELEGRALNTLCAIDVLGVAAMYRTDVPIDARCRTCGDMVRVARVEDGRALRSASPAQVIVWYVFVFAGGTALSCCPAIAFFWSDQHLQQCLGAQTYRRMEARLTMDEALELGRTAFGPVLVEPLPDEPS